MKKIIPFIFCFAALLSFWGCKKDNYPGAVLSNYIPLLDLRNIYNNAPISLTKETMFGATKISGLVVSDHRGGNAPAGLLMMQDNSRLNIMRGIAIELGSSAADYIPGDSIDVNLEGKTLAREAGVLKLKNRSGCFKIKKRKYCRYKKIEFGKFANRSHYKIKLNYRKAGRL